ncbi:glycosyl hydrolase family 2 [Labedaea rhizosphaerae]|uniref:Glycosyl hydrolase family 2 n=2 Tax=Labedaea rhizosphaerae TaxID=598644 RepID=A0A4V6PVU3_LABRH|nr:glycosyl hydrolase family 2 [Labedaea rhizosphaerae]
MRRRTVALVTGVLTAGSMIMAGPAQAHDAGGWHPKPPPLATPWTHEVGPDNALPEYPRPQLARDQWQNLNGVWQYAAATSDQPPIGQDLAERILVPYPPESGLSGIQRHDDAMYYRRTFTVPGSWHGERVLLNFGAVDQVATVWVNGKQVATHAGGYAAFSADITDALRGHGPQELIVGAVDRNQNGDFPIGKQRTTGDGGILYQGSSGIWQTVWLEPVPETHVSTLDITPAADGTFTITARATGDAPVEVVARTPHGATAGTATGRTNTALKVKIRDAHWWSPGDPYLYTFSVTAGQDKVTSYAGLRTISLVRDDAGRPRMALNGKILFQYGPLDQGFWPDGLYTAPTDEALRYDIAETKALGYNMIRKHTKVEPDRWYYWADRLGMLVWQDMPALPIDLAIPPEQTPEPNAAQQVNYRAGLDELIAQHRSVTSIVSWVPFNEGWGEFATAEIADHVKSLDPTRLVNADSGVNCCYSKPDSGAGDIYDDHTYVGPGTPAVRDDRAIVDGEYGGLGLVVDGHLWPGNPHAYEMEDTKAQLTTRYGELSSKLEDLAANGALSAAVYTQTTDVENEVNGLLTYDRKVVKFDATAIRADNLRVIAAGSAT